MVSEISEIYYLRIFYTVNCSGWVLDIWSSSKGDKTEVDNIDRMCPEDNRREYSVPGMASKVVHVR